MGRPDFEELEVYKLAESLANQIWEIVKKWDYFTKD
ncbi:MAG: four helix bundle protein, partial [Oscillatoriales cyanobacterium]